MKCVLEECRADKNDRVKATFLISLSTLTVTCILLSLEFTLTVVTPKYLHHCLFKSLKKQTDGLMFASYIGASVKCYGYIVVLIIPKVLLNM